MSRTTQSRAHYQACIEALRNRCKELKVFDSICTATTERQQEARELAAKADVMLVVGGRNSANTTRLAEICREAGALTYHIETKDEIDPGWFNIVVDHDLLVGITAGAYTPNWLIEEVVERMAELNEKKQEQEVRDETVEETEVTPERAPEAEADIPEETSPVTETSETEEESIEAPTMEQYDETFNTPEQGDIVVGKVVQVNDEEVLVHVGGKSEDGFPAMSWD